MSRAVYVPLALAAALALPSCSQRGDHAKNDGSTAFGQVHAAISAVPPFTFCVRIDAGTISKVVDVTPGATASVDFAEVPIGLVQFAGFAYGQACAGLTPDSQPSYAGSASAAVQIGQVTALDLELEPVGGAHVGVGFGGGSNDMSLPAPPDLSAPVDLALGPMLLTNPSAIVFNQGGIQTLVLLNQGNAPTGPLTFSLDDADTFSVLNLGNPCAAGLFPGQSCPLRLQAVPPVRAAAGTLLISNGAGLDVSVSLLDTP